MSAFDVAGASIATPAALFFLVAAFVPSDWPHPPYGPREARMFVMALVFGFWSIFCIARLCGASA